MPELFTYKESFFLESGQVIDNLTLAYTVHGSLNEKKDNVIWIFHALTANSDAAEWWPGIVGDQKLFDPQSKYIICVNMPGSCYGSTGPLDKQPATGEPYFHDFPFFTTRDMIRAYQLFRDSLGITRINTGIGGSMGGQQLIEWAIDEPNAFGHIILLATNAVHSPWGIAFNSSQRQAIKNDCTWLRKEKWAGSEGMKVARSIALLSYRNYHTYKAGQEELTNDKTDHFKSESYQEYQGEKLAKRFNAFSYYFLSKGMDAHNVGRGRKSLRHALGTVKAESLVISISSDILFPPEEQRFLAENIPGATYSVIDSKFGHDGFLLEYEQIGNAIREFYQAVKQKEKQEIYSE